MIENLQKTLQNFVSFKCLKNKKINLSPAILKLETLLYQNTYICVNQTCDFENLKIGQHDHKIDQFSDQS